MVTYQQLKEYLETMSPERLQDTATIYVADTEEHYPITSIEVTTEDDVLDVGHVCLVADSRALSYGNPF